MAPYFGQIVQFFPNADDRSAPEVAIITEAHGNDGFNYVDLVAICPRTGIMAPHFVVPQNSNDTPGAPCWVALQNVVKSQIG